VWSLERVGSTIYLGGDFQSIGGQPRDHLAAVDAASAAVTPWNPGATVTVSALAASDGILYAGGYFSILLAKSPDRPTTSTIGSPSGYFIGGVDLVTGQATDLNPEVRGNVYALTAGQGTLFAGGAFSSIERQPRNGLAAFSIGTVDVPAHGETGLSLAAAPNPGFGSTIMSYALPADARVTLRLFDLAGRLVATPLRQEWKRAGPNAERLDLGALEAGVYFCRLDAGNRHRSIKFVRTGR
jgi:hypothetical protein